MLAPPSTPLSTRLRDGSADEHREAEGSAFVTSVVSGDVTSAQYAAYVGMLVDVYGALEDGLEKHADHPLVAAVHDPRLARRARLVDDLARWRGAGQSPASPAASAYVARIRACAARPALLLAHHYTRYLGDLAGGRVLRRHLERRFPASGGFSFYDFPEIGDPVPYRRGYRERLDGLDLDEPTTAALVAETRAAFALSRGLFEEASAQSG